MEDNFESRLKAQEILGTIINEIACSGNTSSAPYEDRINKIIALTGDARYEVFAKIRAALFCF